MCGLYSFRRSAEEVRSLFGNEGLADIPLRQHIGPGQPIAIVRLEEGRRSIALVHWGFIPSWGRKARHSRPLANARGESILDKPSFRTAMRKRRCLVPADGFFQWQGEVPGRKRPFQVHRPDHGLFAIAGLWEIAQAMDGSSIETALFVTVAANEALGAIHHRMPAVIRPEDFDQWLDCERFTAEEAARLLKPVANDYLAAEPVALARQEPPQKKASGEDQLKLL
jgi:putative SOS response-associated peptidase YedK